MAQKPWLRYTDKKSGLWGYKDPNGVIQIVPRFHLLTAADSFYNIIAVDDAVSESSYYLLKNGKRLGRDSLYSFDATYDCESEAKIRFRNWKTRLLGFFNQNGETIIPAEYNYASPFHNGLSVALRDGHFFQDGEHWGWQGGKWVLINDRNEILADSLNIDGDNNTINWYSKRENAVEIDSGISIHIRGTNGLVYSFVDYEREFRRWFKAEFLNTISFGSTEDKKRLLFPKIRYWSEKSGWVIKRGDQFLNKFPAILSIDRFKESELKKLQISPDDLGLNDYIFDAPVYRKYHDGCGNHNASRFPLFEVMISFYKKRVSPIPETGNSSYSDFEKAFELDHQDHFGFLRTELGYRLISVSAK